jgi:hypothetical protein
MGGNLHGASPREAGAVTPARPGPLADSTSHALESVHGDPARAAFRYAPTIHLSSDETLYPVIPHAFAFDGIDNDGDGLVDIADPSELASGMLDLRSVARLHSGRRPFSARIHEPALAQSILSRLDDNRLDAWPIPESTARLLRNAGIEISPRAYCIELPPDNGEADSVLAFLVDPARWNRLDAGLSAGICRRASDSTNHSLSAAQVLRLRHFGVPVLDATVEWVAPPHEPSDGGRVCLLRGMTPWGVRTVFTLYEEADGRFGVYYGHDLHHPAAPNIAALIHARRDSVLRDGFELAPTVPGSVLYRLSGDEARLKGSSLLTLTRVSTPPEPRVGYTVRPNQRTMGLEIGYWLYFLYDIGTGAHVHDAEHAVVFTDGLGDVAAFAADAHGDAAASNVLLRDRHGHLQYQRPQALPRHMSLLVELGKHALAPDRNDDGRFDTGMDANHAHRAAWGQRDLNTAFGIDEMSEFRAEHSFPRSNQFRLPHRLRADADRRSHPVSRGMEEHGPLPWGDAESYSFYPPEDFENLYAMIDDPASTRRAVLDFFALHKACFWGARRNYVTLPDTIMDDAWRILRHWAKHPIDRRDYWTHRAYKDPDLVFKPWLFPRVALFAGVVQAPPHWVVPIGIQVPAPRSPFRVETVRLAFDQNPHLGVLRDARIMLSTGRGAMRSVSGGLGRAGGLRDRPRLLFLLEYSPAQVIAPRLFAQHFRFAPIAGVRAGIGSSRTDWRFHFGIQFETALVPPRHPLGDHAPE